MSDEQRDGQHDSAGAPPPLGSVERPRTIKWAVIGMWIGAAMTVLGVYVFFLEQVAINEKTFGSDPAGLSGLAEMGMLISVGIAAVLALVETALWIAMALANQFGFPWARIAATVLGVAGFLSAIFSLVAATLSDALFPTSIAYNIVNEVIALAILVLLWRPSSTVYYRAMRLRRAWSVVVGEGQAELIPMSSPQLRAIGVDCFVVLMPTLLWARTLLFPRVDRTFCVGCV